MILRTFLALLLAFQTPIIGTGNHKIGVPHGTAGPNLPGTASGYTNSANAEACDSVYATTTAPQGATGGALAVSNFSFSLPGGAIVAGITASIRHEDVTGNGGIQDSSVLLLKSGSPVGTNMASATLWTPGLGQTFGYGGVSSLWGTTWLASDINSSGFGLRFVPKNTDNVDGTATVGVDCVTLTVTY